LPEPVGSTVNRGRCCLITSCSHHPKRSYGLHSTTLARQLGTPVNSDSRRLASSAFIPCVIVAEATTNTSATHVRVLLADDQPTVLTQVGRVLGGEFVIVGTASDGPGLREAATRLEPDVIVLDITMPGFDGFETARRLKQAGSKSKLVFLTVHEDADYAREAMALGAEGFVVKSRLASDLLSAINEAMEGRRFVSPTIEL
jgi:CheY-like chemotaxis protein